MPTSVPTCPPALLSFRGIDDRAGPKQRDRHHRRDDLLTIQTTAAKKVLRLTEDRARWKRMKKRMERKRRDRGTPSEGRRNLERSGFAHPMNDHPCCNELNSRDILRHWPGMWSRRRQRSSRRSTSLRVRPTAYRGRGGRLASANVCPTSMTRRWTMRRSTIVLIANPTSFSRFSTRSTSSSASAFLLSVRSCHRPVVSYS